MYQPKNAVGYRALLTWKQAGEIYHAAKDFTRSRLDKYSDKRLIGHINDSARSVQRNIEEGYKRSTTKEYVQFLGFSRASLEELKGDFEELKREWREGIRWGNRGKEGKIGDSREARAESSEEGKIGDSREGEVGVDGINRSGTREGGIREKVIGEIEGLLDLIYGEDCMMGRQIAALENKMIEEKTLPRGETIRRNWRRSGSAEKKFWNLIGERYGIRRDDKGIVIRDEKGTVGGDEKGIVRRDGKGAVGRDEKGIVRRDEKGTVGGDENGIVRRGESPL